MKLKSLACGWEHRGQVPAPASTSFHLLLLLLPSCLPPLAAGTPAATPSSILGEQIGSCFKEGGGGAAQRMG